MSAQIFDFVPCYEKKRKYESNETIDSIAALLEKGAVSIILATAQAKRLMNG